MLASSGSCIKFWNLKTSSQIQEISTTSDIAALSWNKEGHYLASLHAQTSEISLYRVSQSSGYCSNIIRAIDSPNCIQFANSTPRYIAIAGVKETVLVWDIKNNSKKKAFMVKGAEITNLSFSSSDSHLIVGSRQGEAYLLSNTNNLVSGPIDLFTVKSPVTDVQFSLNSQFTVGACAEDGSVSFLDAKTEKVLKEIPCAHSAPASGLCFSPINELLMITVGYDKKCKSYSVNTKREIISFLSSAPLTSVCFVENGHHIALGTMLGHILIYDLRSLKTPVATLTASKGRVSSIKLQPLETHMNKHDISTSDKMRIIGHHGRSTQGINDSSKSAQLHEGKRSGVTANKSASERSLSSDWSTGHQRIPLEIEDVESPLHSMNKLPLTLDGLGILSPLDKEDCNPLPVLNPHLPHAHLRSEFKPTLADGILSPLQDSTKCSNVSSISGRALKPTSSSRKTSDVYKYLNDEVLSPLDRNGLISPHPLSPGLQRMLKSNISNDSEALPSHSINNTEIRPSDNTDDSDCSNHSTNISDIQKLKPLKSSSINDVMQMTQAIKSNWSVGNNSVQSINSTSFDQLRCDKLNDDLDPVSSKVAPVHKELKVPNCPPIQEENMQAVNMQAVNFDGQDGALEKLTSLIDIREDSLKKDIANHNEESPLASEDIPQDLTHMNLKLVQNCVAEVLESYQFDVNKRFMHMQYLIIKNFLDLKREMKEIIKETSLNEQLLLENERLREEIKRLKATY